MTVTPFASHAPMHRLSAVPSSFCITTTPDNRASPTEPYSGHGGQIDGGLLTFSAKVVRGACRVGSCTMKKSASIRDGFRPQSYWEDADPLSAILRNVPGENRRRMITDYWNAGRLEELDGALLRDEPDEESKLRLGRIHPSSMGGEYLPHYLVGEVEIARICLQSPLRSEFVSLKSGSH